jgi:hypothetical protein
MAMINTLQLAARKNLIQMSSMSLITIVTVIPDFQGTYQQLALIILFFQPPCSKTDLAQFPN